MIGGDYDDDKKMSLLKKWDWDHSGNTSLPHGSEVDASLIQKYLGASNL